MMADIQSLIDKPLLLFAILFVGAMAGVCVEQFTVKQRREAWKRRNPGRWTKRPDAKGKWLPKPAPTVARVSDATDQLRTVMGAHFTIQPLLNKSEAHLFKELDLLVLALNPAWQVMAQVSLGEILRSKDADAYRCINSKRVDLLIVDGECQARHAIEYQGGGHYLSTAAARDAVKKEALRKAGIGYHEVVAGHTTKADLVRLVEKQVPAMRAVS